MVLEVIAQTFSIFAMVLNVSIFAMKKQKNMIVVQFIASVFFTASFFMLGAISGGLMNLAAMVRGIVFMNKKRIGRYKWLFTFGLMVLYFVLYVLGFLLFEKTVNVYNVFIEALPLLGIVMMTIGFAVEGAKKTRIFGFLNSPPWLVYNIITFNIGGIICEIFCMLSIIYGMIKYDRKGVVQNGKV